MMNAGDLTWGMIVGYLLLGGILLAIEHAVQNMRQKKGGTRRRASVIELRSLRRAEREGR